MNALRPFRVIWRSVTLFRVFGVPVQFHSTWFIFPGSLVLLSGAMVGGWAGFFLGFCFLGPLVGSILFHEFAHVLAARKYGCETRRVLVIPFACIAELEAMPLEAAEIWVAGAGPLASFLLSALMWGAAQAIELLNQAPFWYYAHEALVGLSLLNLGLGCFNLLPCFPMDGGRILRALLCVAIQWLLPRRASSALVLATRIAVRYVAWPILIGIVLLTVYYTPLWHHILMCGCLILAAEVEFWWLRESLGSLSVPRELRFLPVTGESLCKGSRGLSKRNRLSLPVSSPLKIRPEVAGVGYLSGSRLALS